MWEESREKENGLFGFSADNEAAEGAAAATAAQRGLLRVRGDQEASAADSAAVRGVGESTEASTEA